MRVPSCVVLITTVAVVGTASPAAATRAGENGLVAFTRGGEVHTATSDGGGVRRLTTGGGAQPNWSADGRRIAFVRGDGVWVMRSDGKGQRRIATGTQPTWSPSGSVVYVGTESDVENACSYSRIYAVTPRGTGQRALTPSAVCHDNTGDPEYASPSHGADGDLIYQVDRSTRGSHHYRITSTTHGVSWDLWHDDGPPYGELPEAGSNASFSDTRFQPDARPHGTDYVVASDVDFDSGTDGRRRLYQQDARGGPPRLLGADLDVSDPTSSPDGAYAAYTVSAPDGPPVVRLYSYATGRASTLLVDAAEPDWQPRR